LFLFEIFEISFYQHLYNIKFAISNTFVCYVKWLFLERVFSDTETSGRPNQQFIHFQQITHDFKVYIRYDRI
jgi:hypothetical protein